MKYNKVKSKGKLLAEARAKALRNKLIADGKLSEDFKNSDMSELELKIRAKGDLNGKLVSINIEDYTMRITRKSLSEKFMTWLSENKDNKFVAHKLEGGLFSLEGVEPWRFSLFDLDLVEDN